jgi:hypothetical protein
MNIISEILSNSTLKQHAAWMFISFLCMFVSMGVDLLTGIQKARKRGVATTSRGLKKTCKKAERYFMPFACTMCMDFLGSVIENFPYCTLVWAIFCCLCEWKSVFENTNTKEQINQAESVGKILIDNKDDIATLLKKLIALAPTNDKDNDLFHDKGTDKEQDSGSEGN